MRRLIPLIFLVGCFDKGVFVQSDGSVATGDGPQPDAPPHVVVPRAVVAGSDFTNGILSKLEVNALAVTQNVVAGAAQSDPVVRQYGNELFVINRFSGNNVTILNAKTLALVDQISIGANTNPQDVAVVGNKLYVPTLGGAGVVVVNRTTAAKTEINLATSLGDPDGKPDCVSVYAIGTKLFVACSMQTNFASVLDSKIAIIDTTTDTYMTSATTPFKNPFGFFQRAPMSFGLGGDLLIPLVDFGGLTTRCVARVATTGTLSVGCFIQNSALGGYPANMSVSADGKTLYLAVAESFSAGKLRAYNFDTGSLSATPISSSGQYIMDVAACPNGDVVASDQTPNASGLRVYRGTTERTTAAQAVGQPPVATGLVCYDSN